MLFASLRTGISGRLTLLVTLLALCACHRSHVDVGRRQIVVHVTTVGDTAPRQAYLSLRADDDTALVVLTAESPGRYVGQISGAPQRATLRVVVPQHATIVAHLWLPSSGDAEFRIRPRALIPLVTADEPSVVGDFNDFKEETGVPLRPTNHGTLRAAIPFHGDSCRFQILGLSAGARGPWIPVSSLVLVKVNGVQTFAGVMTPVTDSLIFEVDTAQRVPNLRAPSVVTVTRDSSLALANALGAEREDVYRFSRMIQAHSPAGATWVRDPVIARAQRALSTSIDSRVRGEALVSILTLASMPSDFLASTSAQFFADVPPGSRLLNDASGASALARAFASAEVPSGAEKLDTFKRLQATRARAYALPIARNSTIDSSPRINAYLALVRTLDAVHDTASLDKAIAEAVAVFPRNAGIAMLPRSVGSGQVLRVGAKFPPFRLTDLDGPQSELTNDVFSGKLTLVDFWGTWCAPCVREIPSMHKAYDAWKEKGFTILSISSDESIDAVKRFRRDKWAMPWMHSWSGAGITTPALSALGVLSFPTAVLVDGEGRIVAIGGAARGDSLQLTIARYLH